MNAIKMYSLLRACRFNTPFLPILQADKPFELVMVSNVIA